MYFNNDKNNTNIDNEFSSKNSGLFNLKDLFSKYKKIFLIGIIVIILLAVMLLLFSNRKMESYLILNGEEIVTIYQGTDYIEPGYEAYNSRDNDLTNKVTIESNLNNDVIGEYEITYKIGNVTKIRYVNVIKRPSDYVFIHLTSINNSVDVYLQKGEQYKEPGYMAITTSGKDLTNKVSVTGKVDTSKKGTYKLTYSIVDSNNVTISVSRKVMVLDSDISLSLNTDKYTNTDVTINVYIVDEYFDYMILPNNKKVTTNKYSYKVSNNGTYTFKTYSKKGKVKEKNIKVSNIDKVAPSGSCSGSYKDGVSTININANDNIGIDRYVINGKSYTSKNITINNELKTVNVIIYDKAGNSKNISCSLSNKNSLGNQNIQIKSGRYSYYYHVKNKTVLTALTEKSYFDNSGVILEMGFVVDIPDMSLIKDLDKIPLIVKLHGGGGYSNESLLNSFIPNTRLGQKQNSAIVLYPCKTTSTNVAWKKYNEAVIGIIDWVIKEYNIDENKISLAGFSRGGGGAWQIAAMNPDKFSALVLIEPSMNGGGIIDWFDNTTLSYPVWIFHGYSDKLGLRATSNRIYDKGCTADTKKKLTIDSKLVHSQYSLNILMDDYNLIDWMLERDRTQDSNFNF